jgi:hypothetical protein
MPFSQDAPGIAGGWWHACHQVSLRRGLLNLLSPPIGTRYQHTEGHLQRQHRQAARTIPAAASSVLFGHEASPRAEENRTHLTQWLAAERQDFARVRSGCGSGARSIPRAIPGLAEDARRMRGEGGP